MPKLSASMERISESPISTMFVRAAKLRGEGRDIIDLTFGEPDFQTPKHAAEAGIQAIREGKTKYTANSGVPELKEAIRSKFLRDYGIDYAMSEVLSGPGAKGLLFTLMQTILDAGDDVIVPTPAYPIFEGIPQLLGCNVIKVAGREETGLKLTPEALDAAITPKSRLLILNSPSNPSGAFYDEDELQALAEVLRKYPELWIISDDVYEDIMFDGHRFVNIAMAAPDLRDRVVVLNGVSKGYAMTGWRVGYIAGPETLVAAVEAVISQTASSAPTMSQYASIAALNGPQDYLKDRAAAFQKRRDLSLERINAIKGLSLSKPGGGIFAFVSAADLIGCRLPDGGTLSGSGDLSLYLLEEAGVATVPGAAFSCDTHIRLSLGTSEEILTDAFDRIEAAVSKIT
ncbi:pyridoxal phosphate-dependent aminotransferase [Roseovarius sp. 2305UL8-3]|uniref:pyridoxal phosphate-dependent aminotransferase n=1 Tax=Roseovarius conchicola TaxID=3121636 RepID=UPI003529151A